MTCGVLLLIATTLRKKFGEAPAEGLGSLIHAKSRAGSHISATPFGRYPPIVVAKLVPTVWDVRRIRPIKLPFGFRAATEDEGSGSSPSSASQPYEDSRERTRESAQEKPEYEFIKLC